MNVSIAQGELLTLAEASRRFPGRPHSNTIRRWIREGVAVDGVGVVKLRGAKCGRRDFVPEPAIAEFLAAQNPHYHDGLSIVDSESHRAAEQRLAELGV